MGWQVSNWLIAGGSAAGRFGNENIDGGRPSGTFATGDGPLNIAANQQQQFETLARLIGRARTRRGFRAFCGREARKRNRLALKGRRSKTALAEKSACEWVGGCFNAHGVPAGEVLDIPASAWRNPQIKGAQVGANIRWGGPAWPKPVAGGAFRLSPARAAIPAPAVPPPRLGADTEDGTCRVGATERMKIAALRREQGDMNGGLQKLVSANEGLTPCGRPVFGGHCAQNRANHKGSPPGRPLRVRGLHHHQAGADRNRDGFGRGLRAPEFFSVERRRT